MCGGIDKSSEDIGCALRVANRRKGNSQLHTQLLGAVEGAAECYENLKATFFSKDCPLRYFLQDLVHGKLQVATFQIGNQCQSFTFSPLPAMEQCTTRKINAKFGGYIDEDDMAVAFHDEPSNGLPPEIPMLSRTKEVFVHLIVQETNVEVKGTKKKTPITTVIGFQLTVGSIIVYAQQFTQPIVLEEGLGVFAVKVSISQVNGHVGNDYKQLLILAGICSASATCSCVCCLRKKRDFHLPSERLQKHRDPGNPPAILDAPKREGKHSVVETSKLWALLTGDGAFNLPDSIYAEYNSQCGSTFYEYLIDIPWIKQNGGFLHLIGGWINHFYAAIATSAVRSS